MDTKIMYMEVTQTSTKNGRISIDVPTESQHKRGDQEKRNPETVYEIDSQQTRSEADSNVRGVRWKEKVRKARRCGEG